MKPVYCCKTTCSHCETHGSDDPNEFTCECPEPGDFDSATCDPRDVALLNCLNFTPKEQPQG